MRRGVSRGYTYKKNILQNLIDKKKKIVITHKYRERNRTSEFWNSYGKIVILFLVTFTIGFAIGCINSATLLLEEKTEATNYIVLFTESIKNKNIDLKLLTKDALFGNIKQVFIPWIIGLIVVGIPIIFIYIMIEGYTLGFTSTSVISSLGVIKGSTFLITGIIPKEIVFIPLLFVILIKAMRFSNKVLKERNVNIAKEFYKYFLMLIIALLIAVGVGLFEVYIGFPLIKFIIDIFVP